MTKRLATGLTILMAATLLGGGVAQAAPPWTGGCTINYTIDKSASGYERQIVRAVRDIGAVTDITFTRVTRDPDITYSTAGESGAVIPIEYTGYTVAGAWDYHRKVIWLLDIYMPGALKRGLVMHETMHALGLDHSDDYNSIMYPAPHGQTSFTLEDLSELLKISVANNCGY